MEILEIIMNNFGKFHNQQMMFHPGINVIYGGNETGKSTMGAFVRGMFFGIDKMRGRGAAKDEYAIRQPWENGGDFSGTIRFRCGEKVFRLDRSFEKNRKRASLVCETDGEELDADGGDLKNLLSGLEEGTFQNTAYISGMTGETARDLADTMENYMINAGNFGNTQIDVGAALEELSQERKKLEREKKKKMTEKVEQLQEISMKIEYARQEAEHLAEEEQSIRQRMEELSQEKAAERNPEEFYREFDSAEDVPCGPGMWRNGKIAMAVMAFAGVCMGLLTTAWQARTAAAAIILAACAGVRFFGKKDAELKEQFRDRKAACREKAVQAEYERQQRRLQRQREELSKHQRQQVNLEWTVSARKEKMRDLEEWEKEYAEIQADKEEMTVLEEKISALFLAADTLKEASSEIYKSYAKNLNGRISEILSFVTEGRYAGVSLDEEFQIRIHTQKRVLSIWQVSRGCMEQIYFAIRMACLDLLDEEKELPLILDDAFLTYDDARLERTLKWLYADGRQVLLFTCHKREQEMMQKLFG